MRRIQSEQEYAENLEVYVKVPVPKPPRTKPITIALIGALAIILAAIIPLVMTNQSSSTQSPVSTPTSLVSTPTSEQRAQALIKQYFSDINNKDYQAAYNLWKDDPQKQSVADFTKAYASTLHDAVTVEDVTALDHETIQVFVTLSVTDKLPSGTGTKTSVYTGYYLVGPQNGVLKILSGQLK